jgi:hypothetical protein
MFRKLAARILQKPVNLLFRGIVWFAFEINEELIDSNVLKERQQQIRDIMFLYFEEIEDGK